MWPSNSGSTVFGKNNGNRLLFPNSKLPLGRSEGLITHTTGSRHIPKGKMREEKLVRGYSPTDVEAKVTKVYENYSMDWRITSISESKIDEVIEG